MINIKISKFVEIGVGDYSESNTRYIFEKNCCRGLIVDKNKNLRNKKISLWKFIHKWIFNYCLEILIKIIIRIFRARGGDNLLNKLSKRFYALPPGERSAASSSSA